MLKPIFGENPLNELLKIIKNNQINEDIEYIDYMNLFRPNRRI